ncbi:MAG: adenylosuccinate lyase [Verrucomicrobiota bacterium]
MSVHPIEFRYYSTAMRTLFTEEAKLQNWLTVEAALAHAHARLGHIPEAAAGVINRNATVAKVRLARVKAIEEKIHHDLMAMVRALTEACGAKAGKYVHLGATSYDIEDTALALQLGAALELIAQDARSLLKTLATLARRTRKLICVGRTHGQHAVPTTYGLKFAIYAEEIRRHLDRLAEARRRIRVGQMTGAVGTQASFGADAPKLQRLVMKALGLTPVMVSNQVIQRDRHAEIVFDLALLAATGEKIAREIRNLQRTEIGEVFEPFRKQQVGSSTMPQKRNPHKSERICSLARIIRAQVAPALENIPLEHERDLTNSAAERVIFPEAFILTDYLLRQLDEILRGLEINKSAIQKNLELTNGLIMSERVMLELVKRGLGRQAAHEILRQAARTAFDANRPLKGILLQDRRVTKIMTAAALDRCLDPAGYIGTAVAQVDAVLKKCRM